MEEQQQQPDMDEVQAELARVSPPVDPSSAVSTDINASTPTETNNNLASNYQSVDSGTETSNIMSNSTVSVGLENKVLSLNSENSGIRDELMSYSDLIRDRIITTKSDITDCQLLEQQYLKASIAPTPDSTRIEPFVNNLHMMLGDDDILRNLQREMFELHVQLLNARLECNNSKLANFTAAPYEKSLYDILLSGYI